MKRFFVQLALLTILGWWVYQAAAEVAVDPSLLFYHATALSVAYLLFLLLTRRRPRVAPFGQLLYLRSQTHPTLRAYMGAELDYAQYLQNFTTEPEVVFAVALRHPTGIVYAAEQPARHSHVIALMAEHGMAGNANTRDQGFITSWGRYVGRKEALGIAQAADQLVRKTAPASQLFSEDLWDGPLLSRQRLYERAVELVRMAQLNAAVVTIETTPRETLAMGSYDLSICVRDAWPVIRSQMAEDLTPSSEHTESVEASPPA